MTTQTATTDRRVDAVLGPGTDAADPGRSEPQLESRVQRREKERARRSLFAAILICAGVPIAIVLSLWNNLTEPFWYNEQWRAYYISNAGNWWAALKNDGAPFPAGWFFLERFSGAVFGSTELTLRLPTAMFLPVGCVLLLLLARRWMSTPAAIVVALVGTLTGTLVSYAVQISEYQIDSVAVVAVVLLHEVAWDAKAPAGRSARIYLAYGGIAVACIFSTPAVFIAGPLLLLDALRAALRRTVGPQLVGAVAAGLIVLLQLVVFVLPQSSLRSTPYWDPQFVPHQGIGSQVAFVWDGLRGFVTGIFTSSAQGAFPGSPIGPAWAWVLTLVFGVLLLVGVVGAVRSERGRTLLFAIVASQVLTLIASYFRYWPFGFVRVNFYLIPLLTLIAGFGAVRLGQGALVLLRASWSHSASTGSRNLWRPVVAIALCLVVIVGIALSATNEIGAYRQIRVSTSAAPYGAKIGLAVASVLNQARPGAAVVVTGHYMTETGWKYYQYEYAGKAMHTGHQIPLSEVAFPVTHGSPTITGFINRLNPREVFLYIPFGTTGQEFGLDVAAITKGRLCHQVASKSFVNSGLLSTLSCSHE